MRNENTYELWEKLKLMGDFGDTYYDKSLLDDMLEDMMITDEKEICTLLPEELLRSFFNVISPLSFMYEDILSLFEQCKAQSSTENIEIEYESNDSVSDSFNIEHFLHAKKVLQEIQVHQNYLVLTKEQLWKLWDIRCQRDTLHIVKSIVYSEWKEQYFHDVNSWPSIKLDYEQIVSGCRIEKELLKAYSFWKELFYYYRSTKIPRGDWVSECQKRKDDLLWQETDFCLNSILENLYLLAENYDELSKEEQIRIKEELDDFIKNLKIVDFSCEVIVEKWNQFLQLPIWKKRHEVYSIWIFTQMIAKFPKDKLSFNIEKGVLSFPFSGACIAKAIYGDEIFEFWTELRTKTSVTPVGSGRKEGIQPDYSIVYGRADNSEDSIVVVECKQYKKSNTKNFSNAIIDYANNRTNAKVLLADYGEINKEKVEGRLGAIKKERYGMFSLCRPGTKCVDDFSIEVYRLVQAKVCDGIFGKQDRILFTLIWDSLQKGQDLDLYLVYRKSGETQDVKVLSYAKAEIVEASYAGDVRECPGKEEIMLQEWNAGIYDIWVNNYTSNLHFGDCKCSLTVNNISTGEKLRIECQPISNSKNWWHVLRANAQEGTISIINKFGDKCL